MVAQNETSVRQAAGEPRRKVENLMAKQESRRRFKSEQARKWALAKRIILLVLGLTLAIAAVIGLKNLKTKLFTKPEDDGKILPNVFVADINIGGMTQEEATNALRVSLSASFSTKDLVVSLPGDQLKISPDQSGARLDVEAVVKKAYAYGRDGTDVENARTRKEAAGKNYAIALLPYLNLDLGQIYSAVEAFCDSYSIEMTQPTVRLEGIRPEYPLKPEDWNEEENGPFEPDFETIVHQNILITLGTPDFILEPDALYDHILDAYSLHRMAISYEAPTLTAPDKVDLVKVFEQLCIAPQDAQLDAKTYEVIPEIYGYGFDIETVTALLENAAYGETVTVPLDFMVPDITQEALVGHLFKSVLAEFTAIYTGTADAARAKNLRIACEALNGYVIKAGETFSFNSIIGPCTTNKGYQVAPTYIGSTATTLGGGISQISSALYCGALQAGLQVTQRHAHAYAVDYTLLGFDAAVTYGSQDLQFVNTTADPIRVLVSTDGTNVTVQLLGTLEGQEGSGSETTPGEGDTPIVPPEEGDAPVVTPGFVRELKNQVLAIYNPNTIYQPMHSDNQQGYTDGHVLQQGISGYEVATYVHTYDAVTGELLSSTLISTDSYAKRDHIVVRIMGGENPTEPSEPPTEPGEIF
jgi:vancomycin resistance protein YoaR